MLFRSGVIALADGFAAPEQLQKLDLSYNSIDDDGATVLARRMLRRCPNIAELELHNCGIGARGTVVLVTEGLHRAPRLRKLRLSDNPVGDEGIAAVARQLKWWRALEEVNVCGDSVSAGARECFVRALCDPRIPPGLQLAHLSRLFRGSVPVASLPRRSTRSPFQALLKWLSRI